jgi:hypothetical protein
MAADKARATSDKSSHIVSFDRDAVDERFAVSDEIGI